MILLLFFLLFLFIGIGFSIWTAMGLSGLIYILIQGQVSLKVLVTNMVTGVDSATLVAIPFFILAGELMNKSGITKRIADFADFFVGRFKGGLAYVAIVVNVIMAGISGSAVADASAVSSILLPAMKEKGYDLPFSAAINASAAVIGPIFPPSIPMIFIGVISGISIGKLFLGGVIPGLMMGVFLAITVFIVSRRKNYPLSTRSFSIPEFLGLLRDTILAIISPLIIIAGIVFGIVTLVEVAVLAIVYILFISLYVYRSISYREILEVLAKTAVFSTSIMIIFAVVGVFQYIVALEQWGEKLKLLIASWQMSKWTFLLLVNLFFIFMGCILDAIPVMLIFFPVLLPTAIGLGIDPAHFGVITVLNLMIGLLTPPIGALLFLETKIANLPFAVLVKAVTPYTLTLFVVLFLCTYIPELVLWIPNLLLK
ncbi:MAG: TRAP transporter large permease [Spirochaetes bacterium]|nr:TRAP transporter large permease [Spirochaetota bacterium]